MPENREESDLRVWPSALHSAFFIPDVVSITMKPSAATFISAIALSDLAYWQLVFSQRGWYFFMNLFFMSTFTSNLSWLYSVSQSGIRAIGNCWLVTAGVSLGEYGPRGQMPAAFSQAGEESGFKAKCGFKFRAKCRPRAHPILAVTLGE